MDKKVLHKHIALTILFLAALAFVVKFGQAAILRLYIESGVGNCRKIPILCMMPQGKINHPAVNKEYIAELLPHKLKGIRIFAPKGFEVVRGRMTKEYYKRRSTQQHSGAIIYLDYESPDFFLGLFPQLEKRGVKDDFEFVRRTMYANLNQIKDLTDAFFVIMKGIFIPDLGNQKSVVMAEFTLSDKKGFINYGLSQDINYFDANIINPDGFFKVYIKDKGANLDLDKALAIISTLTKVK